MVHSHQLFSQTKTIAIVNRVNSVVLYLWMHSYQLFAIAIRLKNGLCTHFIMIVIVNHGRNSFRFYGPFTPTFFST